MLASLSLWKRTLISNDTIWPVITTCNWQELPLLLLFGITATHIVPDGPFHLCWGGGAALPAVSITASSFSPKIKAEMVLPIWRESRWAHVAPLQFVPSKNNSPFFHGACYTEFPLLKKKTRDVVAPMQVLTKGWCQWKAAQKDFNQTQMF